METFQVNYDEVSEKVSHMNGHLSANIERPLQGEHRQLQASMRQVDGGACAGFQSVIEANGRKSAAASAVIDRLLSFLGSASRQIQANEEQIARVFNTTRR